MLSTSRQPARRTISAQARAILGDHPPPRHTGFVRVPLSAVSDVSYIDVPEYLDSLQLLQHAGFDAAPAQPIWQAWDSDTSGNTSGRNTSLFECAREFAVERATERDAWLPSHDLDRAPRNMGIRANHGRNTTSPSIDLLGGLSLLPARYLTGSKLFTSFLRAYPPPSYERRMTGRCWGI